MFKVRASHTDFYFFLLLLKIQMSTILNNFVTVLCPSPAPPVFPGCLTPMPRALGSALYPSLSLPIWMLKPYPHIQFSSVAQISLQPHGLQHARPPCPSPTPRVYSNSCPLCRWCYPTITSSAVPFFTHLQSVPASGSFQMSQFFTSGRQGIGLSASTSVLPMNIQDWFTLDWTGWISL